MIPIKTKNSNLIYKGDGGEIGDLPCERLRLGEIRSVWKLENWEREEIADGANIVLTIKTEPIPPVSLEISYDREEIKKE